MAESEAAIVNAALTYVGHTEFIDDLRDDTDDSAERAVAVAIYDGCRDEVLRAAPWPFATGRVRPAVLDETTLALGEVPGGWGYAYAVPTQSVKIRGIYSGTRNPREDQRVPYVVEYDSLLGYAVILTDAVSPEIVFTTRVVDPGQYPPDFDDALAWKLAIKLAAGLRKDPQTTRLAAVGYQQALAVAYANAASESLGDPTPDADWIAGR